MFSQIKQVIKSKRIRQTKTWKNQAIFAKNETAKTRDIVELLGLSVARVRAILSEMNDVEALGINRNRTYRLKK